MLSEVSQLLSILELDDGVLTNINKYTLLNYITIGVIDILGPQVLHSFILV